MQAQRIVDLFPGARAVLSKGVGDDCAEAFLAILVVDSLGIQGGTRLRTGYKSR